MLSLFDGPDEQRFVIWVKDDGEELHLILTDGEEVWQSPHPITSNDKPASRKHEADHVFMSRLKRALKKDVRDAHGAFEVEIKPLESDMQLVIKETIGTTTTKSILFKFTLDRSYDRKDCFLKIFSQASEQMQKDVLDMISLNKSIADFTTLVESLSNNTKDMTTLKEKLHDELVSKFCMVLNTKKREIERLNERIEELESQYESVQNTQNTQNTQGVVDLSQASQSTTAPNAPKAPRGRAAPKTTTMECVTGTKRKAATKKAAPAASKSKAPARKSARCRVDSESEDELEDSESEDKEEDEAEEEESHQAEDDSREEKGLSDQEMDLFDDEDNVPTVTQGTAPSTQPRGSSDNTPLAARSRGRGKAANAGGSSSSSSGAAGKFKGTTAPPVTLSAPLVADPALLRSVEEEESEEELLHSRPRLARGAAKESPAPTAAKVAGQANTHAVSHVSGAKPVTQQHSPSTEVPHTSKGIVAPAAKSSKSKFYAEDSDEEGNCLDYL